jgi:hypothetical protein
MCYLAGLLSTLIIACYGIASNFLPGISFWFKPDMQFAGVLVDHNQRRAINLSLLVNYLLNRDAYTQIGLTVLQFEGKFCKTDLNGLALFPVQFIPDRGW